jgi:hypothetical protein
MKNRTKTKGIFSEVLKRVSITPGMELKLPKEILQAIQLNIEKTRDSVLSILSKEISRVVATIDTQSVLEEILRNHSIKIQAEIILEPKNKKKRGKR